MPNPCTDAMYSAEQLKQLGLFKLKEAENKPKPEPSFEPFPGVIGR